MDDHGAAEVLNAGLHVFPLDAYAEQPVLLMQLMDQNVGRIETPIWDEYKRIVTEHDVLGASAVGHVERFAFDEEVKNTCYANMVSGESAAYANVILQNGVIWC